MKAWKIAAGILGFLLLVPGAAALWIRSVETRRWGEMERETQRLLSEARSRDAARPVLYGDPVPGNAWDDYSQANPGARVVTRAESDALYYFVTRDRRADPDRVRALVAANTAVFDSLHRGAHRTISAFPADWEKGLSGPRPSNNHAAFAITLAHCRARFLVESGQAGKAAHLLLDVCQFANDCGPIEKVWVWHVCREILDELRHIVVSSPLDGGQLREVEQALERLDRAFPSNRVTTRNRLLMIGMEILRSGDSWSGGHSLRSTWRYGFSDRLMKADAFMTWVRDSALLAAADTAPWPEVQRELAAAQERRGAETNPLVGWSFGEDGGTLGYLRERLAKIRLLRAAARFRATGEILDLEDPFGNRLPCFRDGDGLTIWSVGTNGVDDGGDDGGTETWDTRPVPGKPAFIPGDIVLRARR